MYKNWSTGLGLEDIKLCEIITIFKTGLEFDKCQGQCLMRPVSVFGPGFIRVGLQGWVRVQMDAEGSMESKMCGISQQFWKSGDITLFPLQGSCPEILRQCESV